jgi:hypothetical protein
VTETEESGKIPIVTRTTSNNGTEKQAKNENNETTQNGHKTLLRKKSGSNGGLDDLVGRRLGVMLVSK